MELTLKQFQLRLRHPFTISRESIQMQETLVACLSLNGRTGYGESTANPYYGITMAGMRSEIMSIADSIRSFDFTTAEQFHEFLQQKGLSNFSICALDMAAHDLYGKLRGKPLYVLWNTPMQDYPMTNYTIGLDTIENMVAKMKEKPWPVYKIKLGTDRDVSIVEALRKHTDSVFRVDANGAWTARETIAKAPHLRNLGVEFLEQPLPAGNWAGMEEVIHHSVIPVFADESCVTEADVEKCSLHFNGINIKLTKCGGLTPALRMIRKGRSLGLKIMAGCMTESTVGISALAQLLPQLDHVDMDGAMLLADDIAEGVKVRDDGSIFFPETAGCGVSLK